MKRQILSSTETRGTQLWEQAKRFMAEARRYQFDKILIHQDIDLGVLSKLMGFISPQISLIWLKRQNSSNLYDY